MRAIVTSDRPVSRTIIVVAAGVGVLAAVTLVLWARYGAAVFHEMVAAGLALCF